MATLNNPEQQARTVAINRRRVGPLSPSFGRTPAHARKVWHTRLDGGRVCFRSTWEAAFAVWLDARGDYWEYEPCAYPVVLADGALATYTPDFRVAEGWYEVKGRWTPEGRAKFDAFSEQYPGELIRVVDRDWMTAHGLLVANKAVLS
jgi:hypothetical protein